MVDPGPIATYGIWITDPSTTNTTVSTIPNSSARPRTLSRRNGVEMIGSSSLRYARVSSRDRRRPGHHASA